MERIWQLKMDHQVDNRRLKRAYCPNIYTVFLVFIDPLTNDLMNMYIYSIQDNMVDWFINQSLIKLCRKIGKIQAFLPKKIGKIFLTFNPYP